MMTERADLVFAVHLWVLAYGAHQIFQRVFGMTLTEWDELHQL